MRATNNEPQTTVRDSPLHTACVFVVGKNYRLQDIQLRKSRNFIGVHLRAARYGGQPSIGSPRGLPIHLRATRLGGQSRTWLANRSSARRQFRRAKVGEYRARTGDLLVANQALSQLS
jgi:hypothetical protein